ncbi:helix-turn-helix domain-containing protein [Flavilitoribacter nigricans]|uniref:HTH cro/C1-type domain-containing protein n=1 Tax=Flavilitoribacter nigricans (strain ATCC 23147 / DSM 23189 / NBRC 102662 / NCIMB 1420 / SS-2) TaxID=1122177 RepID=A0A2D0NE97_FLAN2|nr:helix-turn-helix transcriptional regulator [Flavilitoribacter nigricans]PHN06831.1 hypothetical protein CRP01_11140 [Flavilitoribacter nigricans DSM 23189 = NBRC 102662]
MEINQRIKGIIDYYQLEQQEFAEKIGVSESTISVTVRNIKPVGAKVVFNILREFPDVSCEWLIRGDGEMLLRKSESKQLKEPQSTITQTQYQDLLQRLEKLSNDFDDFRNE